MPKFNILDKVFIKSLKKEGTVIGASCNGNGLIIYQVKYEDEYWDGAGMATYLATNNVFINTYENDLEPISTKTNQNILKCQCGKEKHGFAKHSDWCDIKE